MPFSQDPRCGFHYYPDTLHYRETDLQAWLPELRALGVSWLVLRSEVDRAIPEGFLRGIKLAGIQPIIQFQLPLEGMPALKDIATLLEVYAHWGARYVIFFDRPNARASWHASAWVQQDLVERFLDRFLPLAHLALAFGMVPVFPPLEPGGSYWDTAFLRSSLQAIARRKQELLLQSLVLSAYAWTNGRSLDWGAGGPQAWPKARPYLSEQGNPDQRGFRIFDWYESIAGSVLNQNVPVILLQAGLPADPLTLPAQAVQSAGYSEACKSIARLLGGETVADPLFPGKNLAPLPAQVIACNFWLLGADPSSPLAEQAWYTAGGKKHALAKWLKDWRSEHKETPAVEKPASKEIGHSIRHYLLLPGFEWGVSDWYLEIIRPFVKKHLPTVGFSSVEAERAALVTIVGNPQNYPEDLLRRLQKAGCKIEQIDGDGTKIASELAER
jgi:hypothetical protein